MHIPDNYLSPSTCAVMGVVMVPIWAKAVQRVKKTLTKKRLPLMGIGAAFSFLVMMFNVPIPGGTTGHAVGATLLALLLGPEAACISVSTALLIQALLFGDGGILSFGANCFNMAFVIPFTGYYLYHFLKSKIKNDKAEYILMFIASYIAINAAALCAATEFGIQPMLFKDASGQPLYCPYPLSVSIPAMLLAHMTVAGVVEGIVTAGVYAFIKKVSPEIISEAPASGKKLKPIFVLIIAMICLCPIGLLAQGTAWGEWGADEIKAVSSSGKALGFVPKGMTHGFNFSALMPDYSVKGMPDAFGYILSAIAGAAILLIVFKLAGNFKKSDESI